MMRQPRRKEGGTAGMWSRSPTQESVPPPGIIPWFNTPNTFRVVRVLPRAWYDTA